MYCVARRLWSVSSVRVYVSKTQTGSRLCLLSVSMSLPVLHIELLVYLREDAMHHHLSNSHAYVYRQHACACVCVKASVRGECERRVCETRVRALTSMPSYTTLSAYVCVYTSASYVYTPVSPHTHTTSSPHTYTSMRTHRRVWRHRYSSCVCAHIHRSMRQARHRWRE